jgi:asparagine synthase (glutamine-hydrolysing)
MCGIAGYASFAQGRRVDPGLIAAMMATMRHRGPDDQGTAAFDQVALGNNRLSILDLAGGHQPMFSPDRNLVVVYNGEIYNFPELRRELETKGRQFVTNCDTELLLHLYAEQGRDFLSSLDGMFTFALYDRAKKKLLIARDRFGVKPLYYMQQKGMLYFASEIKALKTVPGFDPTPDPRGISTLLGLMYIPDPWSIYRSVHKLKPGHFLELSQDGLKEGEYYDLDFGRKNDISRQEAVRQTGALLRQAVKRQMLADVPVGVLISGGLDSRSVLSAASEVRPGLNSFTISFSESEFDEGGEAALWAGLLNSPHQPMLYKEDDFCAQLLERQEHLDEPYALWCNTASAAMARFIHQQGYKVVLSGDGGDELFLGYPTVHAANAAKLYHLLPAAIRDRVIRPLTRNLPAGNGRLPATFKLKSFVEADHPDLFRMFFGFKEVVRYADWPKLLTPEALALVGEHDPYLAFSQYLPRVNDWAFIDALSYFDFKVFLPGCSFAGADNAYMASSVELRVPFMDNQLAEFVTRLPLKARFHPLKLKYLLHQAFQSEFPAVKQVDPKLLAAYKKNGFEVPGNTWLKHGKFIELLRQVLSPKRLAATGFFRPQAVERILNDQLAGRQNNERVLQVIMSLVLFLDGTYQASP